MRVSVIIPSYKVAHCIARAVRSVLAQTEQDLEVIIVDDASTDGTLAIASQLAHEDPRVRCIALPENAGKSHAMNVATAAAAGAWIAVLDADDWYAPERLTTLIDAAEQHGVDMVADNLSYMDEHAHALSRFAFEASAPRLVNFDQFLANSDPFKLFDFGMLKPIFRTRFLRERGVAYEVKARRGQDWYMLFDYFAAGGVGLIHHAAHYYYTQPIGSISKKRAAGDRKPYPYDQYLAVNCLYEQRFAGRLSAHQAARLRERGHALKALAHWQEVKSTASAGQLSRALALTATAPSYCWKMLPKKVLAKMADARTRGARLGS
jgi:succinoglycan biosynthesis protein ExoO